MSKCNICSSFSLVLLLPTDKLPKVKMVSIFEKYFSSSTLKPNEDLHLRKIFKPIYVLLSLFGLFPYSIKFNNIKENYNIVKRSKYVNSVCAVSLLLVMYASFVAHVRYLISSRDGSSSLNDTIITQMNYILELSTLLITCTIIYVCTYWNKRHYVNILNEILSTWNNLNGENNNKLLAKLRFQVHFILSSLLLLVILQTCVNFTREDIIWTKILVMLSFVFPQMIQMITLAFYYVLIKMVITILRSINEYALEFVKNTIDTNESFYNVDTMLSSVKLRKMEIGYAKATKIVKEINEVFQGIILITTLQSFHATVSEANIIHHGVKLQTHNLHTIINCSLWILYQLLKIYGLAHSGNLLKNEAQEIGQSLSNISIEKLDMRMLMEIQHFSSLMNCHGTEMTVYGYFSLDATLMFKMISTATMYLLILAQFDGTDD